MNTTTNTDEEKIVIPNFDEQIATFTDLARHMVPTRNKENVTAFAQAVERVFREKGWNYSLYCKKITMDAYDRKHPNKPGKQVEPEYDSTIVGNELKNLIDNMAKVK